LIVWSSTQKWPRVRIQGILRVPILRSGHCGAWA
jgi:hypothetical protein